MYCFQFEQIFKIHIFSSSLMLRFYGAPKGTLKEGKKKNELKSVFIFLLQLFSLFNVPLGAPKVTPQREDFFLSINNNSNSVTPLCLYSDLWNESSEARLHTPHHLISAWVLCVCVSVNVCKCFGGCGGPFEVLPCCVCVWSDRQRLTEKRGWTATGQTTGVSFEHGLPPCECPLYL